MSISSVPNEFKLNVTIQSDVSSAKVLSTGSCLVPGEQEKFRWFGGVGGGSGH